MPPFEQVVGHGQGGPWHGRETEEQYEHDEAPSVLLETPRQDFRRYSTLLRQYLDAFPSSDEDSLFSAPPEYRLTPQVGFNDLPVEELKKAHEAISENESLDPRRKTDLLSRLDVAIAERQRKGDISLEKGVNNLEIRALFAVASAILQIDRQEWREKKGQYIEEINKRLHKIEFSIPAKKGVPGFERPQVFRMTELAGKGEYGVFIRVVNVETHRVYGLKMSRPQNMLARPDHQHSLPQAYKEGYDTTVTTYPVAFGDAPAFLNELFMLIVAQLTERVQAPGDEDQDDPAVVGIYEGRILTHPDRPEPEDIMMIALIDLEDEGAINHPDVRQVLSDPYHLMTVSLDLLKKLGGQIHGKMGICHGDVKPGNVLLTETPNAKGVRFCDLGTARPLSRRGLESVIDRVAARLGAHSPLERIREQLDKTGIPWKNLPNTGSYPYAPMEPATETSEPKLLEPIDEQFDVYCAGSTLMDMIGGLPPTPENIAKVELSLPSDSLQYQLWSIAKKLRLPRQHRWTLVQAHTEIAKLFHVYLQQQERQKHEVEPVELGEEAIELFDDVPELESAAVVVLEEGEQPPSIFDGDGWEAPRIRNLVPPSAEGLFDDEEPTDEIPPRTGAAVVQVPGRETIRKIVDAETGLVIEVDDPEADWVDDEE